MFAKLISIGVAMAVYRLIPYLTRRYSMLTRLISTGVAMAMLAVAPAMAQQKVTIGVSLASDTNPFYIAMKSGILARAKETGVNVTFVTANENQSQQINGMQDLIARKVDAMLVSPIDSTAVAGAYEMAGKAGIPVISVARSANSPYQKQVVTHNWEAVGKNIGNWVAENIGKKGKVAMIAGPAGASLFRDLATGFKEAIAKHPNIQLVFLRNVALTREQGLKQAEDILTAHPDVAAIYGANYEIGLGAAQAVQTAGKTKKIVVTGLNGVPPAVRAVKEGTLSLTYDLNPPKWGAVALDVATAYARQKTVSDAEIKLDGKLIDARNVQ